MAPMKEGMEETTMSELSKTLASLDDLQWIDVQFGTERTFVIIPKTGFQRIMAIVPKMKDFKFD